MNDSNDPLIPARAPTTEADGSRRWLYPERRAGSYAKTRVRVAVGLMLFYLIAPWISFNGVPFLRIDLRDGFIYFAGVTFPFSDVAFIWLLLAIVAVALFLFTALFGRVWCSHACPQTVYVEWLIRPIEEFFEGPASKRKARDMKPMDRSLLMLRIGKHLTYLAVSAIIANAFLAYFIDPRELLHWISSSPTEHPRAFALMSFVLLATYADLTWFREQFCSFLCPYARFQSILMDEASPAATYDNKRGEPRGRGAGKGDCIDCELCVRVCPAGIDIRNGLQLECIQCARCVDACDEIMTNLKRPKGLVRVTTLNQLAGQSLSILQKTRRMSYGIAFVCLIIGAVFLIETRSQLKMTLLRQEGSPVVELTGGLIANTFRLRIFNRGAEKSSYHIVLKEPLFGKLMCGACSGTLGAHEEKMISIVVAMPNSPEAKKIERVSFLNTGPNQEIEAPFIHKGAP